METIKCGGSNDGRCDQQIRNESPLMRRMRLLRRVCKQDGKNWEEIVNVVTEVMAFSMNYTPTSYTLTSNGFRVPNESFHWQWWRRKRKPILVSTKQYPNYRKFRCNLSCVCEYLPECEENDEWNWPRIPKYSIKTILMRFAADLPVFCFIAISRWLFSVYIHWSSS